MEPRPLEQIEAICNLVEDNPGIRVVLTHGKIPIQPQWQQRRPTAAECWDHLNTRLENNPQVGIQPASIGYGVVDVDHGDALAVALNAPPALYEPSRNAPNRAHLWYKSKGHYPNKLKWNWKCPVSGIECSGEVFSAGNCQIVLWGNTACQLLRLPTLQNTWDTWPQSLLMNNHVLSASLETAMKTLEINKQENEQRTAPQPHAPLYDVITTSDQLWNEHVFEATLTQISAFEESVWSDAGMALEGSARKGAISHAAAKRLWDNWSMTCPEKYNQRVQDTRWEYWQKRQGNLMTMASFISGHKGR